MSREDMRSLFPAFRGELLEVSQETYARLKQWFPEVDLPSCFRDADAWLWQAPTRRKPRNVRRFLVNWVKRAKVCTLRNAEAWRLRQEAYEREIGIGGQQ